MNETDIRELVHATERQIASLLSKLEMQTGCYVDGLAVRSIDVTRLESPGVECLRRVEVDLRRPPGSRWQT